MEKRKKVGNVGFSGRDREGRLGNGREKEMGMSETRNGKACVGSGSKEEPEKLLYDGREKKGWSWPLASVDGEMAEMVGFLDLGQNWQKEGCRKR